MNIIGLELKVSHFPEWRQELCAFQKKGDTIYDRILGVSKVFRLVKHMEQGGNTHIDTTFSAVREGHQRMTLWCRVALCKELEFYAD